MRLREFATNSAMMSLIPLAQSMIRLFTVPILTAILTPQEFGVIQLIANSLALLTFALNLGLDSSFTVFMGQAQSERERIRISSTILLVRIVTFGPATLAVIALAGPINQLLFAEHEARQVIWLAICGHFLSTLYQHFSFVLRSLERHRQRFVLEMISVVSQTLVTVTLIVGFAWRIEAFYVAAIGTAGILLPVGMYLTRPYWRLGFSVECLRDLLRFGLPLVPAGLSAYAVLQTSSFFITNYGSLTEVGHFSIAARFAALIQIVTGPFQQVWAPYIHRHFREEEAPSNFVLIFSVYNSVLFAAVLFVSLFSRELVRLFTNPNFYEAYVYVPLIATSLASYAIGGFFGVGIGIRRKSYHRAWIAIIHAGTFLGLAFSLGGLFGIWGVLVSSIIANLVFGALIQFISQRLFPVPYPWSRVLLMWAGGVCIVGLVYGTPALQGGPLTLGGIAAKAGLAVAGLMLPVVLRLVPLEAGLFVWRLMFNKQKASQGGSARKRTARGLNKKNHQ